MILYQMALMKRYTRYIIEKQNVINVLEYKYTRRKRK